MWNNETSMDNLSDGLTLEEVQNTEREDVESSYRNINLLSITGLLCTYSVERWVLLFLEKRC